MTRSMPPVRIRIVIIGAGVAGLSAFLLLRKHLRDFVDIQIYEARDQRSRPSSSPLAPTNDRTRNLFESFGAAIGLAPNGLAVVGRLDNDGTILNEVLRCGNGIGTWQFKNARGWRVFEADEVDGGNGSQGLENTVMIARFVFWNILCKAVVDSDPGAIITRQIIGIEKEHGGKITVRFENESKDICDLVIGADGVWSTVRKLICTQSEQLMQNPVTDEEKLKDLVSPRHEGLIGYGGFVPTSILQEVGLPHNALSLTFGPNGFFGCASVGILDDFARSTAESNIERMAIWWSTFSSDEAHVQTRTVLSNGEGESAFDSERALQDLVNRQGKWASPYLQTVLRYLSVDNTMHRSYPAYTTPELPFWHKDNTILIGDAAHALQSTSGQGTSQALEDAEALCLTLKYSLNRFRSTDAGEGSVTAAISHCLVCFEQFRRPRISKTYAYSQRMSKKKMDMSFAAELVTYFFIWISVKLGLMRDHQRQMHEYRLPIELDQFLSSKNR